MDTKATRGPSARPHMGDRLETLLRERALRQVDLGERLGWSRQRLSLKIGQRTWKADTILAIAQALDVPTDYFFYDRITPPSKVVKGSR